MGKKTVQSDDRKHDAYYDRLEAQEVRMTALQCAVRLVDSEVLPTPESALIIAKRFEQYIREG